MHVLDNCSRAGTEKNRAHLESLGNSRLELIDGQDSHTGVVTPVRAPCQAQYVLTLFLETAKNQVCQETILKFGASYRAARTRSRAAAKISATAGSM